MIAASIASRSGESSIDGQHAREPVVRVRARERVAELGEDAGEERAHRVAEDDRVRDLHHRRLHVQGEEDVLAPWRRRSAPPGTRRARARRMTARVDDLAREDRDRLLQHGRRAVGADELDPQRRRRRRSSPSVSVERKSPSDIVETCDLDSVDHAPIECGCERGERLHGRGRATVRVALAQHRVDRGALHAVVGLARGRSSSDGGSSPGSPGRRSPPPAAP